MSELAVGRDLRTKIAGMLDVSDSQIDACVGLFNRLIKPELKKNYLSHLKTSIEDLINDKKRTAYLNALQGSGLDDDARITLYNMLQSKRLRPFVIILQAHPSPAKKASTNLHAGGAVVNFFKDLEDRQKRILIAHELSHIALKFLGDENNARSENVVNLLALTAMLDKNQFYKTDSNEFVYQTADELLSEFELLCIGRR